jgi:hypothetical protein
MTVARENPFASSRVERLRYRWPGFALEQHLPRLERLSWRGVILGPHGSGKTTLLLELFDHLSRSQPLGRHCQLWMVGRERDLQTQQWLELSAGWRPNGILLVDGIERLPWFARQRLLGRTQVFSRSAIPRSIIATSHQSLGLPVWVDCKTDEALMEQLVLELLPHASPVLIEEAKQQFQASAGNIRQVFWKLYDKMSNPNLQMARACQTELGDKDNSLRSQLSQ